MKTYAVYISTIKNGITHQPNNGDYAVCWIKNEEATVEIDQTPYENIANAILFLDPKYHWKVIKYNTSKPSGYILHLSKEVFESPLLKNLHISKLRLFNGGEIPLFKLSPGIEKRTQAILEMIDELLSSQLNHKEEAILSLLNTFFVYCDGQCNIKSIASNNNSKANKVYAFKKLVDTHIIEKHEVADYANQLNISPKYLNECVQEVLSVSAKSIIIEQLLMKSRYALKFSTKSIKEISFELGFSSPDYFSYFFKTHTGMKPSTLRKA